MSERGLPRAGAVISLDNLAVFQDYACTWFANVATLYLINRSVYSVTRQDLGALYEEALRYVNALVSERGVDPHALIPLPLTPNDDKSLFTVGNALNMLHDALQGRVGVVPLPPALSFEFVEYVRVLMPRLVTSFLKREAVFITMEVLALAVLGAQISRAYRLEDEYGYVFVSTYNPLATNVRKANDMVRFLVGRVIDGEGSVTALIVGVASVLALTVGKMLNEIDGRSVYTSLRIVRSRNKNMLASFERIDLTDLAKTIMRLRLASPIYNLITRYPSREEARDEGARTLRTLIEALARAVLVYHTQRDPEELYKTLRFASTKHTVEKLTSYLKEAWDKIYMGLLSVKV